MDDSKRLTFLKAYLKLFGVEEIILIDEAVDSISGIAIYDATVPGERQEFIWYKRENELPSSELNMLIDKIVAEKLHEGDKISQCVVEMEFEENDHSTTEKMLQELFDIQIKMIDDGEETDSYFVHY